jgi:hypothetical protein
VDGILLTVYFLNSYIISLISNICLWPDYFGSFIKTSMKPVIIKLNLAGTTVHVNAHQILYYYAKQDKEGKVVTELFFTEKFGLEVSETPAEIDTMIAGEGKLVDIMTHE